MLHAAPPSIGRSDYRFAWCRRSVEASSIASIAVLARRSTHAGRCAALCSPPERLAHAHPRTPDPPMPSGHPTTLLLRARPHPMHPRSAARYSRCRPHRSSLGCTPRRPRAAAPRGAPSWPTHRARRRSCRTRGRGARRAAARTRWPRSARGQTTRCWPPCTLGSFLMASAPAHGERGARTLSLRGLQRTIEGRKKGLSGVVPASTTSLRSAARRGAASGAAPMRDGLKQRSATSMGSGNLALRLQQVLGAKRRIPRS